MVAKPLAQRIEDGFAGGTLDAFGMHYFDLLLVSWNDLARALRRTTTLMVLLAVAFVLLAGADEAEVALGPLKLTNIATVLPIVPALVSFFIYEFVVLQLANERYKEVAEELLKQMHPAIVANDLERMLRPATVTLWGAEAWAGVRSAPARWPGEVLDAMTRVIGLSLFLGGVGFLGYAFVDLYGTDGASDLAVSVSLAFALFNLARAGLTVEDAD